MRNAWKIAKHLSLLENYKSELQWDISSYQSEWPSSKSLQTLKAGEGVEKREHSHCWWECKLIKPLWKMVGRFLKKLGMKSPYDPAIPLLGMYPKETKIEKDTCIPLFIAALFTIAKTWKEPWCPLTDEWIKKCGSYTQWNITKP